MRLKKFFGVTDALIASKDQRIQTLEEIITHNERTIEAQKKSIQILQEHLAEHGCLEFADIDMDPRELLRHFL